jgi:hypothetical protein
MTLGALIAWGWLPSLQDAPRPATRTCELPTLPSKRLETLAQGRAYATGTGGEVLTLKGKLKEAREKFEVLRNGGYAPRGRGQVTGQDVEMGRVNRHNTAISGVLHSRVNPDRRDLSEII